MKKFNGTSWVNATAKRFNGTTWVSATAKKFNGTTWVDIGNNTLKSNVKANWSNVYKGNNTKATNLGARLQQGQYPNDGKGNGLCKSLIGFPLSGFVGKDIKKIRIYLASIDWYYKDGGIVNIGWHNHSSSPSTFQHDKYSAVKGKFTLRVQGQWFDMPQAFINGVKKGTIKGVSIFYNNPDWHGYGRFHAHNTNYPPQLEITYSS